VAVLSCPECEQKLRIPDGKRGKVGCPVCGAGWLYPEAIELSGVEFRCAKNGAPFHVILSRRPPLRQFAIEKITALLQFRDGPFSSTLQIQTERLRDRKALLLGSSIFLTSNEMQLRMRPTTKMLKVFKQPFRHPTRQETLTTTIGRDLSVPTARRRASLVAARIISFVMGP